MLLRAAISALPLFMFSLSSVFAQIIIPQGTIHQNIVDGEILENITGAGSFTQARTGNVTLSGTNDYSGGTNLNAGFLTVDSDSKLGAPSGALTFNGGTLLTSSGITSNRSIIIGDGGATIDANNQNSIFTGMIINNASGDGQPFIMNGPGQVTLTANNTYTGATIVDMGVLTLGNGGNTGSVLGDIALFNPPAEVQFNRLDDNSIDNRIMGMGSVRKLGTNKLTILGNIGDEQTEKTSNIPVFIEGGKLQIGDNNNKGSVIGNIDVSKNAELIFKRSDDIIYNQVISGEGRVTQAGSGSTTLTNTSIYTGNTLVEKGTLYVNGSIAKSAQTTVESGATLAGTGTVGNTINNGIVNPGTKDVLIGTLNFSGNFVNNGKLIIDVTSGKADQINVASQATLGGTLTINGTGTGYTRGQRFTLVNTEGAAKLSNNRFTDVTYTGSFGGLRPLITYENGDMFLILNGVLPDVLPFSAGMNTKNAAVSIDKATLAGFKPQIITNLDTLSGAALEKAVDQFTGEIANTGKQAGLELGNQFMRAMLDPFTSRECLSDCGQKQLREMAPNRPSVTMPVPKNEGKWLGWTSVSASQKTIDGDIIQATHATKITPISAATGMEYRYNDRATAGFALSGGQASYSLSDNLGSGINNAALLGVYGRFTSGDYGLSAAAFTSFQDMDYKRTVTVGALSENLQGKSTGVSFGGRLEASRKVEAGALVVSPYVALQAQTFRMNGYGEKALGGGGATAALIYGSQTSTSVRSEIGFGVEYATNLRNRLNFRVAYAREYANGVSTQAAFAGAANVPFTTYGASGNKDSMIVKAGTDYAITTAVKLTGNLTGEFSGSSRVMAADVAVKWVW